MSTSFYGPVTFPKAGDYAAGTIASALIGPGGNYHERLLMGKLSELRHKLVLVKPVAHQAGIAQPRHRYTENLTTEIEYAELQLAAGRVMVTMQAVSKAQATTSQDSVTADISHEIVTAEIPQDLMTADTPQDLVTSSRSSITTDNGRAASSFRMHVTIHTLKTYAPELAGSAWRHLKNGGGYLVRGIVNQPALRKDRQKEMIVDIDRMLLFLDRAIEYWVDGHWTNNPKDPKK